MKAFKGLENKKMTQNGFEVQITEVGKAIDVLKLGDHYGNRFAIILRLIEPQPEEDLVSRFDLLKTNGFINYFG